MAELDITYRFEDDKEAIKRIQEVSLDLKSKSGLKIENGLLVGSDNWFTAIKSGQIEKHSIYGTIFKVYMASHNDYPEFEIDSNGEKSTWTRKGVDELYKVGKRIELSYVVQKYKRSWGVTGPITKIVVEIRIEK